VGNNGVGYCLTVFIADITSLRHRGLVQALLASSTIITAWLAGPISTAVLTGPGWRWGFGVVTILVPVITVPFFVLFKIQFSKAKKLGLVSERSSGATIVESLRYYAREFDIIGLLLFSTGVAFFLLPFNLYAIQAKGWGSAIIISFLVLSIVLLVGFGICESSFRENYISPMLTYSYQGRSFSPRSLSFHGNFYVIAQ
jgi:MFS family permease